MTQAIEDKVRLHLDDVLRVVSFGERYGDYLHIYNTGGREGDESTMRRFHHGVDDIVAMEPFSPMGEAVYPYLPDWAQAYAHALAYLWDYIPEPLRDSLRHSARPVDVIVCPALKEHSFFHTQDDDSKGIYIENLLRGRPLVCVQTSMRPNVSVQKNFPFRLGPDYHGHHEAREYTQSLVHELGHHVDARSCLSERPSSASCCCRC